MFGHRFGRNHPALGAWASSSPYAMSSSAPVRQVKYVYDWLNPISPSRCIIGGAVNASARNTRSGCRVRRSASAHSQKASGLVCGLSTRKTRMPRAAQNSKMSRQAAHIARRSASSSGQKFSGKMSSYRLGGFSAVRMLPSVRCTNHSGCSVTHGWSGLHCSATSMATCTPSDAAWATNRSKSSNVPRSGCRAVWPPSGLPMAHGLPTSPGPAVRELLRPLRLVVPIGCTGGR